MGDRRTGLFGTKESFVPLAAARVEGDELVVDIPKSKVHEAPRIDEEGHLSEEQETELYTYYGVSQGQSAGRRRPRPVRATWPPRRRRAWPRRGPTRTGTPLGDQDVAQAMGGRGFAKTDTTGEESGPTSPAARSVVTGVGGGLSGGPDFARGQDASVTGARRGRAGLRRGAT